MNHLLKTLAVLIPLIFLYLLAAATSSQAQQATDTTTAWEQHSEGVALRVLLLTKGQGDKQQHVLQIDIKNDTDHAITFGGIEIYYIDITGQTVSLYDDGESTNINRPFYIQPGKIRQQNVDLFPDKLNLVKTCPVFVSFTFHDPVAKQDYSIKSTPGLLTETASK